MTLVANIKLNIGCGVDYREGFVNIDGSTRLGKVDLVMDIGSGELRCHFGTDSVDFILANDIVEHVFHWEAVRLLADFFAMLKPGGRCEIRVPDAEYIIKSWRFTAEQKLTMLFGGQDIPQGVDSDMDASRREFPEYFCHKYGWTRHRLQEELMKIGFHTIKIKRVNTNLVVTASKPD